MRTCIITLAVLLLQCGKLSAQGITISMNTGYGFYNMNSLKDFTKSNFDPIPFDAKIISNYPPYLFYQPVVLYTVHDINFGLTYTFQSSGSRISAKDYSGEYLLDSRIKANSAGIVVGYLNKNYKSIHFGLHLGVGLTYSYLQIDEAFSLDSTKQTNQYKLKNNNAYIEPGLNVRYPLSNWGFELNLGYQAEFKRTDFKLIDNQDIKIEVKKGMSHPDIWNGFRLGFTVSYTLMKKAKAESQ